MVITSTIQSALCAGPSLSLNPTEFEAERCTPTSSVLFTTERVRTCRIDSCWRSRLSGWRPCSHRPTWEASFVYNVGHGGRAVQPDEDMDWPAVGLDLRPRPAAQLLQACGVWIGYVYGR